ncbi:MAG: hypothetical protein ACI85O_000357 [Saprospiraceae bacterium]|jgi:hypothetical protein
MSKSITNDVKAEVLEKITAFNEKHKTTFQMTFRGKFAYLSKTEKGKGKGDVANSFLRILSQKMGIPMSEMPQANNAATVETKIGRLKYGGEIDDWDFAVFRYSREIYDADEWMFPGAEHLDGTIEGALRAGIEVYP